MKNLSIDTAEKANPAPFVPFLFVRTEADGRRILCQAMTRRCPMGSRSILIVADFGNGPESPANADAFAEAGNRHRGLTSAASLVCETLFQDVVNGREGEPLSVTREQLAQIYEAARLALDSRIGD